MARISKAALDLIIAEEVSSKAYYEKRYQHFDWPKGASGPTVGIGYDCGYCTPGEIREDWAGLLAPEQIDVLVEASGIKGKKAGAWVRDNKGRVTIPYVVAQRQFHEREMAKWISRVETELENTDKLSPDALGALVSLAYNRGSFNARGSRRREMLEIKQHMADERFELIPDCIRSMKRLWSPSSGLIRRRDREANLFLQGLDADDAARSGHDREEAHMAPPPPPSMAKEAAKSKTVHVGNGIIALIVAKVSGFLETVASWFGAAVDAAGDTATEVGDTISPLQALAKLVQVNLTGAIWTSIIVILVIVMMSRHVRDKVRLAAAEAQGGDEREVLDA